MELSVLKLASPRRKAVHSARFTFDNDFGYVISSPTSPPGSAPTTPRLSDALSDDDMFTIFQQHPAAIPFKWEETPGMPRSSGGSLKGEVSGSEQDLEDSSTISRSSSRSSANSSDVSSNNPDPSFHVKPVDSITEMTNTADKPTELLQFPPSLPLKPPPRMQSIKQLLTLEKEDYSVSTRSFSSLITNTAPTRSFRKDGLKALPFLTSPRKEHTNQELINTMLGFEECPNLKRNGAGGEHRRSNWSFSFRKKCEEKENDADTIFTEDFGKKGGLRECRPLLSMSARGLADGYNFKGQSWGYDSYMDDSDRQLDVKTVYFENDFIAEEDPVKDQQQENDLKSVVDSTQSSKEKPKKSAFTNLTRFFRSIRSTPSSSVSPAPLPPLEPTPIQSLKAKPISKYKNPLLEMCLSNSVSQAIIRNVKQLRSFDFRPRYAAA